MPIAPNKTGSEEAEPTIQADSAVAQSFNADLRSLLMDLIPEAGVRVVFRDIAGNEHAAPAILSGRRQFKLAIELEKISGSVISKLSALSSTERGREIATMAVIAAKLLVDEELQQALKLAFEIIHPKAVARALELGVVADQEDGEQHAPSVFDLFPAEEVVRAVIPFCLAPIRGIVATVVRTLEKMDQSKP